MTTCLSEESLLGVHLGEAPAGAVRHAACCPRCARHLAALRGDLARIDALLRVPPLPVRRRVSMALRVAPILATAAVLLLVVVARWPAPATRQAERDVVALVDDISSALAPAGADDAPADVAPAIWLDDDDGDEDDAGGRSTCSLDEPFLGVECDNNVQLATLGW